MLFLTTRVFLCLENQCSQKRHNFSLYKLNVVIELSYVIFITESRY